MTYVELREEVVRKIDRNGKESLKVSDVDNVLKYVQEIIMERVSEGDKVVIPGFLTFAPLEKKEQRGIAFPNTDKQVEWVKPAHTTITAKLSTAFKTNFEVANNPCLKVEKEKETQE